MAFNAHDQPYRLSGIGCDIEFGIAPSATPKAHQTFKDLTCLIYVYIWTYARLMYIRFLVVNY